MLQFESSDITLSTSGYEKTPQRENVVDHKPIKRGYEMQKHHTPKGKHVAITKRQLIEKNEKTNRK